MVTPALKKEHYEKRRKLTWPTLGFTLGAYVNLIPLSSPLNPSTISGIHWVLVGINSASMIFALANYIYYTVKIDHLRNAVLERS